MDDGFSAATSMPAMAYRPCYFGGDAAEIAISIAAELIAVRARREGREKHRPAAK